jgi:hypothetical protein
MPYNDKYFFEFDTLKTANKVTKYYRVVFSKLEDIAVTYDLVQLTPSNSPFVLSYKSSEDNAFSPIKTSSAEINILYPYDANTNVPEPEIFLNNTQEAQWLVRFYEITSNGAVTALKWQGYLLNDVQYEWQDAYYYRLVATDNLAVLKDVKYSDDAEFKFPAYLPSDGISVKDLIITMVNKTGSLLNYKFAWEMYADSNAIRLDSLWGSLYTLMDWKTFQPKTIYPVLEDLLRTLGCIIYQDNNDATWTILSVNEISTRTDNEVPYDMYDSDGVYISSGDIFLNSSINTGETDLVWRDKNQIVSFLKPIGGYSLSIPYIAKNLLGNYSFQQDPFNTLPPDITNWETTGTFDAVTANEIQNQFGQTYDDYALVIDQSGVNSGALDVANYISQTVNIQGSRLVNTGPNNQYMVYLEFKTYNRTNTSASVGEGFNFRLATQLDAPINTCFYDTEEYAANRDNGGQWIYGVASGLGRTAVRASYDSPYQRISIFTKAIALQDNSIPIRVDFLEFRYDPLTGSSGQYLLDETKLNITSTSYRYLDKLKFFANFNKKFATLNKESVFTGGFNEFTDWYMFEGALGIKDALNDTFYCEDKWDRHFEAHNESTENYFDAIISKNVLSFYRNISRKFTGNIYGEQISYPKYFKIQGAVNTNSVIDFANAFEQRVLTDGGTCETTYCGSNYLSEFFVSNAKFLMIEASFDYQQSTTSVNLHEDLTNTIEPGFTAGFGGFQYGQGSFPGSLGASTNSEQEPVEPS